MFRYLAILVVLALGIQVYLLVWLHAGHDGVLLDSLGLKKHREVDVNGGSMPSVDDATGSDNNNDNDQQLQQRLRPLIDPRSILEKAGVQLDSNSLSRLPKPGDIESMYGEGPIVLGLETCDSFRSSFAPEDRYVAPAGSFNTGTNLLATVLRRNCYIPEREGAFEDVWKSGMKFQVPWGKHNPVSWRLHNVAEQGGFLEGEKQEAVLPIVVVRDPISWMSSMCRHPYGVQLAGNCRGTTMVGVTHGVTTWYRDKATRYESLMDLWHTWYGDWIHNSNFPALFIRFEDIIFHGEELTKQVCDCAGGKMRDQFFIKEESAKGEIGSHKGGSGFLESVIKNGDAMKRKEALQNSDDLDHLKSEKFADMLSLLHYLIPE